MSASKFFVFATDHIFHNVSKLPLCIRDLNLFDKTLRCNRSSKSNSNIPKHQSNPYDRCRRNVEALSRCSKKARVKQYCGKQIPSHKVRQIRYFLRTYHKRISCKRLRSTFVMRKCQGTMCDAVKIVSDFEEARRRVNYLIEEITRFFNEERLTIVESLKNEARIDKDGVCSWLKNISDSTDQKLQYLIELDSCFGSEIRLTVLRYKDHARNKFIDLHCELAPSVKQIESILEKIQVEVTQCLQKAAALTLLCRCGDSPSSFKKCLFRNTAEAEMILERTMQETRIKLKEVRKLRDYLLKCHKEELTAETNYHVSEMQALSRYLDDCIASFKKQTK